MSKLLRRPPVEIATRKSFTKAQRARAFAAAGGRCALCGEKIIGPWEIDHVLEHDLGGKHDPSNWRVLHKACHQKRTSDRAPVLAKVHRLHDEHFGEPEPSKRPIPNRPFNKTLRKKVNGTVERRVTDEANRQHPGRRVNTDSPTIGEV